MPEPEELMRKEHQRQQINRWREQLIERVDNAQRVQEQTRFTPAYQYTRRMETPLAQGIPTDDAIVQQAPPAQIHESRRARKKREEREKAMDLARLQELKVQQM